MILSNDGLRNLLVRAAKFAPVGAAIRLDVRLESVEEQFGATVVGHATDTQAGAGPGGRDLVKEEEAVLGAAIRPTPSEAIEAALEQAAGV